MCGIAGLTTDDQANLTAEMISAIAHRGPDGNGIWRGNKCTLGHARLAIIDVQGGSQPMSDRAGGRHIVFNGEIYNHRQLRRELGEGSFRTQCDTEAILNLSARRQPLEQWVPRLDGMFAFAMLDDGELVLARDPLGIKPLYTARKDGAMVFASELKALPPGSSDIKEFPPGHAYSSRTGLRRYYYVPVHLPNAGDIDLAVQGILKRLENAVQKRLLADVPVGVFLSGGLDSSLIAALAKKHKCPLDTFSVGTADSDDRRYALEMARVLDTRHHERVYTIEEAQEAIPKVIYHLESFDCALVRSAIPNYFLAELAAKHVKVALSGEGADELFAGYEYLTHMDMTALQMELLEITGELHNTNLQRCDRMSMAHGLEVRVPFLDVEMVDYAFRIPVDLKLRGWPRVEKWILRQAASKLLPPETAFRRKSKFAIGSGLGDSLAKLADRKITDREFLRERKVAKNFVLRSKEELLYYREFRRMFPDKQLLGTIGRSRSV